MNKRASAVLVVDDDRDVVSGLRRLLSLDGYDVEVAESIAGMLDRADWSRFFAILLDRKLSDGNAEDSLPALKELAPYAEVIVITGHSDLQSTLASFRSGAADYLLKPVDPETLRNRLRRISELRLAREALQREETEHRELQRHVLEIAAEEQRRIGSELHDGTQQELTALALFANTLVATLNTATSSDEAGKTNWLLEDAEYLRLQRTASKLSQGLAEAYRHVHALSHAIMPVQIDAEGLRSALETLAAATNEQAEVTCHFECSDDSVAVPDNSTSMHLFRIAQEALHNAVRHGQAKDIHISLARSVNQIILEVSDNGRGFDFPASHRAASAGGGMGLRIMEYRAGIIGGMIQVESNETGGIRVRCTVPSVNGKALITDSAGGCSFE